MKKRSTASPGATAPEQHAAQQAQRGTAPVGDYTRAIVERHEGRRDANRAQANRSSTPDGGAAADGAPGIEGNTPNTPAQSDRPWWAGDPEEAIAKLAEIEKRRGARQTEAYRRVGAREAEQARAERMQRRAGGADRGLQAILRLGKSLGIEQGNLDGLEREWKEQIAALAAGGEVEREWRRRQAEQKTAAMRAHAAQKAAEARAEREQARAEQVQRMVLLAMKAAEGLNAKDMQAFVDDVAKAQSEWMPNRSDEATDAELAREAMAATVKEKPGVMRDIGQIVRGKWMFDKSGRPVVTAPGWCMQGGLAVRNGWREVPRYGEAIGEHLARHAYETVEQEREAVEWLANRDAWTAGMRGDAWERVDVAGAMAAVRPELREEVGQVIEKVYGQARSMRRISRRRGEWSLWKRDGLFRLADLMRKRGTAEGRDWGRSIGGTATELGAQLGMSPVAFGMLMHVLGLPKGNKVRRQRNGRRQVVYRLVFDWVVALIGEKERCIEDQKQEADAEYEAAMKRVRRGIGAVWEKWARGGCEIGRRCLAEAVRNGSARLMGYSAERVEFLAGMKPGQLKPG